MNASPVIPVSLPVVIGVPVSGTMPNRLIIKQGTFTVYSLLVLSLLYPC